MFLFGFKHLIATRNVGSFKQVKGVYICIKHLPTKFHYQYKIFHNKSTVLLTQGLTLNDWLFTNLLISCTICIKKQNKLCENIKKYS